MILRRITKHVKDQNWFAVGLDFFIVVTGILIAFQITNWSEGRTLAKRQVTAVERLHAESEEIIIYFKGPIGFFGSANDGRADLIEAMIDGTWEKFDDPSQNAFLLQIGLAPAAAPPRTAYDELVSIGFFAEIGDAELRSSIADYYAQLDFLKGQIIYGRTVLADLGQWQGEGVETVFNRQLKSDRGRIYDLKTLSADKKFMRYLIEGHGIQRNSTSFWQGTLDAAKAMCEDLSRVSGKPCAPLAGEEDIP